jgi:hypothetical protein
MKNELSFEEVVDTSVDLIEASTVLADALKDGFQITDLASLFAVVPKVQELAKDGRVAIDQLLDLSPDEAEQVATEIARRTRTNPSVVVLKVNEALTLLARTYRLVKNGQNLLKDFQTFAKTLKTAAE